MKSQIQYFHLLPKTIEIPSHESWILLDEANDDADKIIILAE